MSGGDFKSSRESFSSGGRLGCPNIENSQCPDKSQLEQLARGEISMESQLDLELHLQACPRCRELVDELEKRQSGLFSFFSYDSGGRLRQQSFELQSDEAQRAPLFQPGQRISVYEIRHQLGQGGMGTVYEAWHTVLKRPVAIKFIRPRHGLNPQVITRFKREIEIAGRLDNPHIVVTHDAGEIDGFPYLVMERLEGETLQQKIDRSGPADLLTALNFIRQAALGLQYAHASGLVHRDIKPANLWLTKTGTVKILDLGLASIQITENQERASHSDHLSSTIAGTPDYMAPEQAIPWGRVTAEADIYSLGCTLFFLLTGKPPFSGPEFKSVQQKLCGHTRCDFPNLEQFRAGLGPSIHFLLRRMTARNAEQRYQGMEQVLHAANLLLQGKTLELSDLNQNPKPLAKPVSPPLTNLVPPPLPETESYLQAAQFLSQPEKRSSCSCMGCLSGIGCASLLFFAFCFLCAIFVDPDKEEQNQVKENPAQISEPQSAADVSDTEIQSLLSKNIGVPPSGSRDKAFNLNAAPNSEGNLSTNAHDFMKQRAEPSQDDLPDENSGYLERSDTIEVEGTALKDSKEKDSGEKESPASSTTDQVASEKKLTPEEQLLAKYLVLSREELLPLAEQGDSEAQFHLGFRNLMNIDNRGADKKKAIEWLEKSAEKDHFTALLILADCYHTGNGVPLDIEKAIRLYNRAAQVGDKGEAYGYLGRLYYQNGEMEKASVYIEEAAKRGDRIDQFLIGIMYLHEIGVTKDLARGLDWIKKSAKQKYAPAYVQLGICYQTGLGVLPDFPEAAECFRQAGLLLDMEGLRRYGLCLLEGIGVPKDEKMAAKLLVTAAERGDADAQYQIGLMYRDGIGVIKDQQEAKRWNYKAAQQKHIKAVEEQIRWSKRL